MARVELSQYSVCTKKYRLCSLTGPSFLFPHHARSSPASCQPFKPRGLPSPLARLNFFFFFEKRARALLAPRGSVFLKQNKKQIWTRQEPC